MKRITVLSKKEIKKVRECDEEGLSLFVYLIEPDTVLDSVCYLIPTFFKKEEREEMNIY